MLPVIANIHYSEIGKKYGRAPIPESIFSLYNIIHVVHRVWYWNRKREIYTNKENFIYLIAGHTLNFIVGNTKAIKIAAECVHIANCILSCKNQYDRLFKACVKLKTALLGKYIIGKPCAWSTQSKIISASTINKINNFKRRYGEKIKRIALCILEIAKELFELSMRSIQLYNAFYYPNHTEQVSEIFLNAKECIDGLMANKKSLASQLKKHRKCITHILQKVGSEYKFDKILDVVEKTVSRAEIIQDLIDVKNGIKRVIFGESAQEKSASLEAKKAKINASRTLPARLVSSPSRVRELQKTRARYKTLTPTKPIELSQPQTV